MESGQHTLDFTEKLSDKSFSDKVERNNRIINSAIAYLAAYSITYVFFQVLTALFSRKYFLFHKLYFFKVEFTQDTELWTLDSVRKAFLYPSALMVVLGIVALVIQRQIRKRPGIWKVFWLWLSIHSINLFCAQMILMPIRDYSKGIVASYLGMLADYWYWEDYIKISFSILACLIMILIGYLAAKPFIQITNSAKDINKNENRFIYLFQTVILPYLICSAIVMIFYSDGSFLFNLTTILTMVVILISLFIEAMKNKMIMIYRLPENGQIENRFLVFLVGGLIFLKIFLNNGVGF
jgi:hypothetical protein